MNSLGKWKTATQMTALTILLATRDPRFSIYSLAGIHAVNLGDSGFIIVREGCTILWSPVQQHDFNFTYQLESGNGCDLPSAAQAFAVPVAAGDVIIAGTDGLFDNLYNNEVTAVVVHAVRAGFGPHVTAQKIAALARQRALDKERQTPFSTAAQDAGYRYHGEFQITMSGAALSDLKVLPMLRLEKRSDNSTKAALIFIFIGVLEQFCCGMTAFSLVSIFVKACKDQIDILKNRIYDKEKIGNSNRWLPILDDSSRADVIAHKHGMVLILSEWLHSVTAQFDRLRSIRFQDAVNRAKPRRKMHKVSVAKSLEASKPDVADFGEQEPASSSGPVRVQDQLLDDETRALQNEMESA